MRPTSARPITSADAVIAVRRGLRIAFGARQDARRPEATQRCAEGAHRRPDHDRQQQHHTEQHSERAERDHLDLLEDAAGVSGAREAVREECTARDQHHQSDGDAASERADGPLGHVGDGRDRRHARRPHCRDRGRDHGDHDADEQRDDDGAGEHDRGRRREVEPDLAQQVEETDPEQDPHPEPDRRGHRADHERLEHHRPHHLTTGGTHGSQQTELAGALGHQDREGVEDDEGADHHPDGREAEQRVGEEAEELPHRLADVDRRLRGGLHLVLRAEHGLDACLQLGGADVGVALHVHRVDGAGGTELTLRGRQVERGHRHRTQVGGVAVREEPDDLVLLGRAAQQHADVVAHVEPVLPGGAGIHRHLIGAVGGVPVGHPERALHPRDAERGRTAAADRVAVAIDELREGRLHEPLRRPHAGHRSHLRRERIRDAAGGRRAAQG